MSSNLMMLAILPGILIIIYIYIIDAEIIRRKRLRHTGLGDF